MAIRENLERVVVQDSARVLHAHGYAPLPVSWELCPHYVRRTPTGRDVVMVSSDDHWTFYRVPEERVTAVQDSLTRPREHGNHAWRSARFLGGGLVDYVRQPPGDCGRPSVQIGRG